MLVKIETRNSINMLHCIYRELGHEPLRFDVANAADWTPEDLEPKPSLIFHSLDYEEETRKYTSS